MAFLDNSGDIILDAVLTDTGRYRLAQGNGSFKITKFALGDDEINYGSYDKNNASGSAYYDLEILQTPILEAFTNNTSTMKSKLLSIPRTNLLYLPVLVQDSTQATAKPSGSSEIHVVCVDETTVGSSNAAGFLVDTAGQGTVADIALTNGFLNGFQPGQQQNLIRVDQGLNTTEIAATSAIDADLLETQYIIEIDNRLATLTRANGDYAPAQISFVDDDNIASYYFSLGTDRDSFMGNMSGQGYDSNIKGPAGTTIFFMLQASIELQTSTYLFEQLGAQTTMFNVAGASQDVRYIDSNIKVTGATTGYSINLPIRFIKSIPA
tara:strand:+ start:9873 stop:10841 length:969 start_codon:yes stop_codon:yes gene_type:complete